ncbi:MAG: 50S ribosomal protein L11 methyltransferase [Ignavibacteriales bacterium]|nr:50S ribosomal protein L11 methyltransferase [Ignavibacteriales bacterium]
MEENAWIELSLQLPFSHQDLLTGQFASMGFSGFQQEDGLLKCFVPKKEWTGGFRSKVKGVLGRFGREFPRLDLRFNLRTIRQENWNKRWEHSIQPIEATDRVVIKPSWKKARRRDKRKIVIVIDPKMSFGTGHHETTRLSLRLLQEHLQPHSSVLDFGSGTGILAIAAAKLGARSVVAIDNDVWAASNAMENVKKNNVTRRVRILKGAAKNIPRCRFEIIIANIDLPTILQSLQSFVKHLKPEGILLLSGLLLKDLTTLLPQLSHRGLVPLGLVCENEWVALSLVRC